MKTRDHLDAAWKNDAPERRMAWYENKLRLYFPPLVRGNFRCAGACGAAFALQRMAELREPGRLRLGV